MAAGSYLPIHPLLITSHCPPASLSALHPSTLCYWGVVPKDRRKSGVIFPSALKQMEREPNLGTSHFCFAQGCPTAIFLSPPRNPCDPFPLVSHAQPCVLHAHNLQHPSGTASLKQIQKWQTPSKILAVTLEMQLDGCSLALGTAAHQLWPPLCR